MKQTLKKEKSIIDKRLECFFDAKIARMNFVSSIGKTLFEQIKDFTLRGGKRIRPILVVEAYRACGGKSQAIYDAAIAIELMESYLLVHDDVMDQDELRRGYLTMHKTFEARATKLKKADSVRYGENMAIIAGDLLAVLGTEAILHSKFPVRRRQRAVDKFNRAIINTGIGQAIDVGGSRDKKHIEKLYELKTAIYTFEAPLHIGAMLAGADKRKLENLTRYAIPLGKAFQIKDDILGLFGTRQRIGKPVGSDIREGKGTLMILEAMDLCTAKDRAFIEKCLGNHNLKDSDIQKVQSIVRECGALDIMEQKARMLADKAESVLRIKSPFLKWLARYVVQRDY